MENDFTLLGFRLKAIAEVLIYSQYIVDATHDREFINSVNDLFAEELLRVSDVLLKENVEDDDCE